KVAPSDGSSNDYFGLALSGLGVSSFVVGAYGDDDQGPSSGSAYFFTSGSSNWVQTDKVVASDGYDYDRFGLPVSGMGGSCCVVGAHGDDDQGTYSGSAYVFTRSDSGSWLQGGKVVTSDGTAYDFFSLALSSISGRSFVAGAYGDDDHGSSSGSAYVFTKTSDSGGWSQAEKVVASDGGTKNDYFGRAVSGYIGQHFFIVGAYGDDDQGTMSGSAYVFTSDSSSSWVQAVKVVASDGNNNDYFGRAVSIISNSSFVVGSHGDDDLGPSSGSVYVFTQSSSSGSWAQAEKVVASDGSSEEYFGFALSGMDGNSFVIGANEEDVQGTDSGSVYVFTSGSGSWFQVSKVVAHDGSSIGWAVSSINGSSFVAGAPSDDDNGLSSGSVYVFTRTTTAPSTFAPTLTATSSNKKDFVYSQAKVVASDGNSGDYFGCAVGAYGSSYFIVLATDDHWGDEFGKAVSGISDNSFVVGAHEDASAYVFTRESSSWEQAFKVLASDDQTNDFGSAVSGMSESSFLVGAHEDGSQGSYAGSVYVFTRISGSWLHASKIIAQDGGSDDHFGYAVSSMDGSSFAVGAFGYGSQDQDSETGSVYVFTGSSGSWVQAGKVLASDGDSSYFGFAVSGISQGAFVAGACRDDEQGSYSGSAYVVTSSYGSWVQAEKVLASDGISDDYFGFAVSSITTSSFVVGAIGDDDHGSHTGSAYLFTLDSSEWVQAGKVLASDGSTSDFFGQSVYRVGGSSFAVGAPYDDDQGSSSGSVYVFSYYDEGTSNIPETNYYQIDKVVAQDGSANDWFGYAVGGLSKGLFVVGSVQDDDQGLLNSGSVHIFTDSFSGWVQEGKVVASDGGNQDFFGEAVARLDYSSFAVGAWASDNQGSASGSVYIFTSSAAFIWVQIDKVVASDGVSDDAFGAALASLSSSSLVVTAKYDDVQGLNSGSAYIFTSFEGSWLQAGKVVSLDEEATDDLLGRSAAALSGCSFVVGVSKDDDQGSSSGSAYIFTKSQTLVHTTDKIVASDGAVDDLFGKSVAMLNGTSFVVGAIGDDDQGSASGSVYVF
ncbi:unnamed protein product, partial [Heterosigma akashiwo]